GGQRARDRGGGGGRGDWGGERVSPPKAPLSPAGRGEQERCKVTVLLRQKAEYNEPTVLGFCLGRREVYQVRVPVIPQAGVLELPEIPARVEPLADNRVRVEVTLPGRPTHVAVDRDEMLVDRNPCNNYWKPRVRFRLTRLYTFLEENDLTNSYDRWNVIAGPWVFAPTYDNPFFTRATRFGLRAGVYRNAAFE